MIRRWTQMDADGMDTEWDVQDDLPLESFKLFRIAIWIRC